MVKLRLQLNSWEDYWKGIDKEFWVFLPMTENELKKVLTANGSEQAEWRVVDFVWENFPDLYIDENLDILKMNKALLTVNEFDENELRKLKAITETDTYIELEDAIHSMKSTVFWEGEDIEQMVKDWVFSLNLPDEIIDYIDFEDIERDWRFNGYHNTSYGVIKQI